jgi:hypothetical protein
MNVVLWVLQVLLALHTAMGAVWKLSHTPEQTMPSLKAIPQGAWLAMSGFEMLCALSLVLPAFYGSLGVLAPVAAGGIAAEMLFLTAVHYRAGNPRHGPAIYWLVVAALCAFIAYGRLVLLPA